MSQSDEPQRELDPLFVSSLRELKWILVAWGVNFAWVIGFCLSRGYETDGAELSLVLGMPAWVFWGVMLPMICVTLFTAWFALTQMADHPLEDPETEEPGCFYKLGIVQHHEGLKWSIRSRTIDDAVFASGSIEGAH